MITPQPHPKFERSLFAIRLSRGYAALAFVTLPLQVWSALGDRVRLDLWIAPTLGVLQIVAMYSFGSWFRMAYSKLPILGIVRPRYTPAMAVAVFFVPFSNLFRPAEVITELYTGTEPSRSRLMRLRPIGAQAAAWWYAFLGSSILGDVVVGLTLRKPEAVSRLTTVFVAAAAQMLAASAALGATRFVREIRERQERCATLLRLDKKFADAVLLEDDGFQPSGKLTILVRALLVGSMVARVGVAVVLLRPARSSGAGTSMPVPLLLLNGAVSIATFVILMRWFHRIVSNIRRATPFPLSPAFAVGGFLIPLLQIVHPWLTLQKIWRWLDRINGGIDDESSRTITLAEEERPRSGLIDRWWFCMLALIAIAGFLRPDEGAELAIALLLELLFFLIGTASLYRIVDRIGLKVASLEKFVRKQREFGYVEKALPDSDESAPHATWVEVLLPIASSIDDGLRLDPREVRDEREQTEMARDEERLAAAAQRRWEKQSVYASAAMLTRTLRVLLLLGIFLAAGEAFLLPIVSVSLPRSLPRIVLIVGMSILVTMAMLLSMVPAWLALSRWAAAQCRNANSTGKWVLDPGLGARRTLTLREPTVFRHLLGERPTFGFQLWNLTLRLLQLAPVWVSVACTLGDRQAIGAALLFFAVVATCLSLTAMLVSDIDARLESLHHALTAEGLNPAAKPSAAPAPAESLPL